MKQRLINKNFFYDNALNEGVNLEYLIYNDEQMKKTLNGSETAYGQFHIYKMEKK